MKKLFVIALALFLAAGTTEVSAQGFLKKLDKTLKKEVENRVVKEVKKAAKRGNNNNQVPQESGEAQPQSANAGKIVPTKIESQWSVAPTSGSLNGHDWVDLGLPSGTRWATCNVGATQPEQSGSLYAWGEVAAKTSYTQGNSKTYSKDIADFSGNKTHDVAAAKWGNGWRMPTEHELAELLHYCSWNYVQKGGRWGSEITSTINGKSIFLPVTGYKDGSKLLDASGNGMYWTATPHEDQWHNAAYMYQFGGALGEMSVGGREYGYAIRPVVDNSDMHNTPSQGQTNGHSWVDLGLPSGTKWATCNIGAATAEHHGYYYSWAETTPVTDKKSEKNNSRSKGMGGIAGSTTYDAATANWGEGWRIPAKRDFQELIDNCTWEWTTLGRIAGCKVTSKINGNYIFIPAAGTLSKNSSYKFPNGLNGVTRYWASTPSKDEHYINADCLLMSENSVMTNTTDRMGGCPIRPVVK